MLKYNFKYNLDHPYRSIEHRNILLNKKILKDIYTKWYDIFKSFVKNDGKYVELGSGGGFIKDIIPQVTTSDINDIPGVDLSFSAEKMPFDNDSLSAIFMIDTFHHIPNVSDFLNEAQRVLKVGGKIIMIEPWNTRWSRFIYNRFHHELFDLTRDWTFESSGPLSGSNMALPYIIFRRDRKVFDEKFQELKLIDIKPHSPFTYLLSGGFSRKAFIPDFLFPLFQKIEQPSWVRKSFAMFVTIIIEKVIR